MPSRATQQWAALFIGGFLIEGQFIGEVRYSLDIGYSKKHQYKIIWIECRNCHKPRWVRYYDHKKGRVPRCMSCYNKVRPSLYGARNPAWKGGKCNDAYGYLLIRIPRDERDKYRPMFKSKGQRAYILEHRYVMAKHLGRCLESHEVVHHKNGNKQDNRIENLELSTKGQHSKDHHDGYRDGFVKGYSDGNNKRIQELENRIRNLETKLDRLSTGKKEDYYASSITA